MIFEFFARKKWSSKAKRNILTWDYESRNLPGSDTMIRNEIDTFRNTTPAVNQDFDRKSQVERNTYYNASSLKTPFCCPII